MQLKFNHVLPLILHAQRSLESELAIGNSHSDIKKLPRFHYMVNIIAKIREYACSFDKNDLNTLLKCMRFDANMNEKPYFTFMLMYNAISKANVYNDDTMFLDVSASKLFKDLGLCLNKPDVDMTRIRVNLQDLRDLLTNLKNVRSLERFILKKFHTQLSSLLDLLICEKSCGDYANNDLFKVVELINKKCTDSDSNVICDMNNMLYDHVDAIFVDMPEKRDEFRTYFKENFKRFGEVKETEKCTMDDAQWKKKYSYGSKSREELDERLAGDNDAGKSPNYRMMRSLLIKLCQRTGDFSFNPSHRIEELTTLLPKQEYTPMV